MINYLRLKVPDNVLVNAGVCDPLSTPEIWKEPLNFSVPLAFANVPVPPVTLAVPESVTVPAPSGALADELTTVRLILPFEPVTVPLPVKVKPALVDVVGTWPEPLNVLVPRSVPVPVPLMEVTVADAEVELLLTMIKDRVPVYFPLKATDELAVVVVTGTALGVTLFEDFELGL